MSTEPRQRPQIMTLTDGAAARVAELCLKGDKPFIGLRIGIKKGGCAGMEYTIEGVSAPVAGDELVEHNGARVYVDSKALLFLLGTQMDYKVDKLSAAFAFNNPNQTGACGCGESVMLRAAESNIS